MHFVSCKHYCILLRQKSIAADTAEVLQHLPSAGLACYLAGKGIASQSEKLGSQKSNVFVLELQRIFSAFENSTWISWLKKTTLSAKS